MTAPGGSRGPRLDAATALLCTLLLAVGEFAPMLVVEFHFDFPESSGLERPIREGLLPLLGVDPDTLMIRESVFGLSFELFGHSEPRMRGLGVLLFTFSVLIPTFKLLHLWSHADVPLSPGTRAWLARYTNLPSQVASFGYVDVIVAAAFGLILSHFPGGTVVRPEAGLFAYWGFLAISARQAKRFHHPATLPCPLSPERLRGWTGHALRTIQRIIG